MQQATPQIDDELEQVLGKAYQSLTSLSQSVKALHRASKCDRNSPCCCGSGKKSKKCCNTVSNASKLEINKKKMISILQILNNPEKE